MTKYEYIGPGYSIATSMHKGQITYNNTLWSVGSLAKRTAPDGSSETFKWQRRELSGAKEKLYELGIVSDSKIWAADLQEYVAERNGTLYTTQYSNYDAFGNPGTRTESGPNGGSRVTTLTYFNDPVKWIIGRPKDETSPARSVTRTLDANGKVLSLTRDGVSTHYTYDSQGNLASQLMPGNRLYTYSNYKRDIAQNETQPEGITLSREVDSAGNIITQTNGAAHTTRYTYDGLNRVTSITPPLGTATTIVYTSNRKTATQGGLVETTEYDPFGRVTRVTRGGITTLYEYDALGRRTFVSHPDASTGTRYRYDVLDRVTQQSNADGTVQNTVYGPATKTITDERGQTTTFTYRAYGDPEQLYLIAVAAPDASASLVLTRDSRDQISTVTQGGFTRSYTYSSAGYLVSISNPETGVTLYGRDIAGNMITRTVGASGTTRYTYDGQNRLRSTVYADNTPAISNTYDKTGKLLTSAAAGGNRSFAYDAAGNLIQETLALDGKTFTAMYAYNGLNQLSSITYPQSGRVVRYTPDVLGRPTTVSGFIDAISYWPSGLVRQLAYANGTVSSYGQDARLWPAHFSTRNAAGAMYLDSSYTYDGSGNLATIRDTTDSSFNRTLGYDAINRLSTVAGFWGEGHITYSGDGNILQQTLGQSSLAYHYDSHNRLSTVSGLRAGTYDYDAYGNVSSSTGNTYTYDSVPNLVCINCAIPQSKVEYRYDALNLRSSVTTAGVKVYEMHDSKGKPLIELEEGRLTEYIYLGDKRIAQEVTP
ncbi:RHS repeat protein [Pseudomonas brassicae]